MDHSATCHLTWKNEHITKFDIRLVCHVMWLYTVNFAHLHNQPVGCVTSGPTVPSAVIGLYNTSYNFHCFDRRWHCFGHFGYAMPFKYSSSTVQKKSIQRRDNIKFSMTYRWPDHMLFHFSAEANVFPNELNRLTDGNKTTTQQSVYMLNDQ